MSKKTIKLKGLTSSKEKEEAPEQQQQPIKEALPTPLDHEPTFKASEERRMIKEFAKNKKSPDEIQKHQEFILMISRYGTSERFAKYLKESGFVLANSKLKKMSMDELEELLERIKTTVSNKNVSDVWSESIMGGLSVGENVITMTMGNRIKIRGLAELLEKDECFQDLLEEIRLENQNLTYVSPYVRVVYMILTSGAKIHALNTLIDQQNKPLKLETPEPLKTDITEKTENTDEKDKEVTITTKKKFIPIEKRVLNFE